MPQIAFWTETRKSVQWIIIETPPQMVNELIIVITIKIVISDGSNEQLLNEKRIN